MPEVSLDEILSNGNQSKFPVSVSFTRERQFPIQRPSPEVTTAFGGESAIIPKGCLGCARTESWEGELYFESLFG